MEVFGWLLILGIVLLSAAIGMVSGKTPESTENEEVGKWKVARLRRRRNVAAVFMIIGPVPFALLSGFLYGTAEVIMLILGTSTVVISALVVVYSHGRLKSIERQYKAV